MTFTETAAFSTCAEAGALAERVRELFEKTNNTQPRVSISLGSDARSWELRVEHSATGVSRRVSELFTPDASSSSAVSRATEGKSKRLTHRSSVPVLVEQVRREFQAVIKAEEDAAPRPRRMSLPLPPPPTELQGSQGPQADDDEKPRPRLEKAGSERRLSLPHVLPRMTLDEVRRRAAETASAAILEQDQGPSREALETAVAKRHSLLAQRVWAAWAESTDELAQGLLASAQEPLVREGPRQSGWLMKQSERYGWSTRYFELKGHQLYYYAAKGDDAPRGVIDISDVEVTLPPAPRTRARRFTWAPTKEAVVEEQQQQQPAGEERRSRRNSTTSRASPAPGLRRRFTWSPRALAAKSGGLGEEEQEEKKEEKKEEDETEEEHSVEITLCGRGRSKLLVSKLRAAPVEQSCVSPCAAETEYVVTRHSKRSAYRLRAATLPDARDWALSLRLAAAHSRLALPDKAAPVVGTRRKSGSKSLSASDAPIDLSSAVPFAARMSIRRSMARVNTVAAFSAVMADWQDELRNVLLPRSHTPTVEQVVKDLSREAITVGDRSFSGEDDTAELVTHLDALVEPFARSLRQRHAMVGTILSSASRTTSGGDSYLLISSLFGGGSALITAVQDADAQPLPIVIAVDAELGCATVGCATEFDVFFDEDFESGPVRLRCEHEERLEFGTGWPERRLTVSCPTAQAAPPGSSSPLRARPACMSPCK